MELPSFSYHYLLQIWYLGDKFAGSQRQPRRRTVESELIQVLTAREYILDVQTNHFRSAVRTDAGVHARCAAVAFMSNKVCNIGELNHFLPEDMGIWAVTQIPLDFHPRFDALWKEYRYLYPISPDDSLDLNLIRDGLSILCGPHDFRLFCRKDPSKPDQSTELTLFNAKLEVHPDYLVFIFRSTHFLWQQIRRMVGFLLDLGSHKRSLEDLQRQFHPDTLALQNAAKNMPAIPGGLILWEMGFPPEVSFQQDSNAETRLRHIFNEKLDYLRLKSTIMHYFLD
jgi:tRNA pseudouridine38-40 synthase